MVLCEVPQQPRCDDEVEEQPDRDREQRRFDEQPPEPLSRGCSKVTRYGWTIAQMTPPSAAVGPSADTIRARVLVVVRCKGASSSVTSSAFTTSSSVVEVKTKAGGRESAGLRRRAEAA